MLNSSYLKELMMEHGMSLGQLSVRTGISKSQLSRILSGERGIGAKTIKGLKNEKELLANQLKVMMKEHEIGIAGDHKIAWKFAKRTSLDSSKLKEVLGERYSEYTKETSYRTLSVA